MEGHEVHQWNLPCDIHRAAILRSATLLSTRAGFPATTPLAGTSRVTTLPAPISEFSPIVTFPRIVAPEPMEAPLPTSVGWTVQSLSVCSSPVAVVARG